MDIDEEKKLLAELGIEWIEPGDDEPTDVLLGGPGFVAAVKNQTGITEDEGDKGNL